MNKNKGFTLIELLVVIAIIGILASVVLSSLNSARASARDAKRTSDIRAFITSMEMYRNQHGQYPAGSGSTPRSECGGSGWCLANPIAISLVNGGFLGQIPNDPTYTNNGRNYQICGTTTSYTIRRWKESINNWCFPPGHPAVYPSCGSGTTASPYWHTYPDC